MFTTISVVTVIALAVIAILLWPIAPWMSALIGCILFLAGAAWVDEKISKEMGLK